LSNNLRCGSTRRLVHTFVISIIAWFQLQAVVHVVLIACGSGILLVNLSPQSIPLLVHCGSSITLLHIILISLFLFNSLFYIAYCGDESPTFESLVCQRILFLDIVLFTLRLCHSLHSLRLSCPLGSIHYRLMKFLCHIHIR
jgi:hypothetical protein